ncbi:MAG: serine/threonine protein kinase [Myxococcota bacterium]|jgi:serine/threonine protein kinase
MSAGPARQYTITAVLGEGGFGKVYRATLASPGGFSKDVAIKLARGDIPEEALRRLRDEARILGLVRDRAIVSVDPPTELDGRWAVVMEYVEGTTCRKLLHEGTFPPRVAIEVVAEVARALDKSYRQAGPGGAPLQLLHRDLKPGNIQITPTGEVKILDFGIAKAQFEQRESKTTRHIGGTIGYIAPERLDGFEGPEGDVFSLGVTLHKLVAGRMPLRRERLNPSQVGSGGDPDESAALGLSARMRDPAPSARPTAREVEDACRTLWASMDGPTLRNWGEENVPKVDPLPADERVGMVLEDRAAAPSAVEQGVAATVPGRSRRRGRRRSSLVRALLAAAVSFMIVLLAGLLSVGAMALIGGVAWVALAPQVPTIEVPPPRPEPSPGRVDTGLPPPAPTPSPSPAPVEQPEARPEPRPAPRPAPAPAPEAVTWPVTISSAPLGAEVFVDGRSIGATPVLNHAIPEGSHMLRLTLGDDVGEQRIRVGSRMPRRYVWRGGDTWESHY